MQSARPKPEDATYAVTEQTHEWSEPTFAWLARERQRLLREARDRGFDAILLVDSDLILGPETLRSLLDTQKSVVSAVFWTRWQRDTPPLPQVWQRHPYEFAGRGLEAHEFLGRLAHRDLVQVGGLGACTLIRAGVLDRVAYWPLLDGLPSGGMWQGEDRHFAVRAQRNHVELWADAWPDVFHAYRPSDVEKADAVSERLSDWSMNAPEFLKPEVGDLISARLEPIEEAALAGFSLPIRGRLGTLKLLPALEEKLKTMTPGSEAFVEVRFPAWWEIPKYRGESRAMRVSLLDVKPNRLPPTLAAESLPPALLYDGLYASAA